MGASIYTIDDFYSDPLYMRHKALDKMEWMDKHGNHPGKRTHSDKHDSVKHAFEDVLGKKITTWDAEWNTHSGCYNLCTQQDRCWIHTDHGTDWAVVIYLTPDAPLSTGTGLYKHKKTGYRVQPEDKELQKEIAKDGLDFTAWEMTDYIGNVFNRAVIYEGKFFHAATQYFGHSPEYCRLHQTFFFHTE